MEFDFDLFVIGGGSGGVRAARVAAAEGVSVGLAEESRLGGTCVIRGCVPKKLMVYASGYGAAITEAQDYGWSAQPGAFDWQKLRPRLHAELDRLECVYQRLLDNSGVKSFAARAVLKDAHTVELSTGEAFTAKHILIATGGRPSRPKADYDTSLGIVSDDIFDFDVLPKSILIIGGGYIACEFACILNGLGVKVTQFYRGPQILRGFDDEARNLVSDAMIRNSVDLRLNTDVVDLSRSDAGYTVKSNQGDDLSVDEVLFATGRHPNTDGLGLDHTSAQLGKSGEIIVDDYSQTAQPSIYAIGDVTDRVALTPVAIREGMDFVQTVFKGNPTKVDHALIPSAVFTQPEMGTVGLSEEDARKLEEIDVFATSFKPMQQAFIGREDKVLMKLIVSQATDKVLGCHIVAPGAGEMIQMAGIAVKMGATKAQFDQVCAVHPTMAEELVTMKTPTRSD